MFHYTGPLNALLGLCPVLAEGEIFFFLFFAWFCVGEKKGKGV